MAKQKVMISADVFASDEFLDMSADAQSLYPQLLLGTDGLGCINGPLKIARSCGAGEGAFDELLESGFVLKVESDFDSAFVVAHYWTQNNLDKYNTPVGCHAALIESKLVLSNVTERRYVPKDHLNRPLGSVEVSCVLEPLRKALYPDDASQAEARLTQDCSQSDTGLRPGGNKTDARQKPEPNYINQGNKAKGVEQAQPPDFLECPDCGDRCLASLDPHGELYAICDRHGAFSRRSSCNAS